MFYRFDLVGNLFDAIPQPSVHSLGWYDLAYDGNLIYGSEQQGIGGGLIVGVDLSGTPQDTIPSPVNPSRAIAYDPDSDHFWVTDLASDLYEITRTGTIVHQFAHDQNVSVSGLAWNPTDQFGYKLYAFHRDSLSHFAKVSRIHPVSGDRQFLVQLTSDPSHRSGGCAITSGWNSSLLVFAGIVQESNVDRLGIWELMFNTTWITVTPMIASVPPNSFRDVSIVFDRTNMRNAMYQVDMTIRNNTTDSSIVVPVVLTVNDLSVDDPTGALPQEFSLYQNYPNPFNSETTFRFDLKQAGATTLKIYNLLGQEVATVVDGVLEAGQHTLSVNMNGLASGVYLYRLESGDFSGVKKLVLMK